MNNRVELPIEVYEHILDALNLNEPGDEPWSQSDRSKSLLACALTCSAWYPRALKLLYSIIQLKTETQCQLYLGALAAHPERAEWAKRLVLRPRTYIPLVPLITPRFLPRCSYLKIGAFMGDPSVGYPPLYITNVLRPLLTGHPGITTLHLAIGRWISASQVLSIMQSNPTLYIIISMYRPSTKAINRTLTQSPEPTRNNAPGGSAITGRLVVNMASHAQEDVTSLRSLLTH
ncbi:hypothetical protein C8Q73DRAFT_524884 [Cubamyces lactineus]|nr:hypothetical protein C8Q73DRAFT_524884 [Cubamyces lactineus]